MLSKVIYFKDDKNSGLLLSEVFSIKGKPSFDYLSEFNAFNFECEKPIKIKNKEELNKLLLIITSVLFNYKDVYNIDKIQIKNYYIQYIIFYTNCKVLLYTIYRVKILYIFLFIYHNTFIQFYYLLYTNFNILYYG